MTEQEEIALRELAAKPHYLPQVAAALGPLSLWSKAGMEAEISRAVEAEREAIAQMFEDAPALVQFAQNDQGGCLVCGFTPKLVIEAIRKRGTT